MTQTTYRLKEPTMIRIPDPPLPVPDDPATAALLLLKLQRGAARAWDAWYEIPGRERLAGSPRSVSFCGLATDASEVYGDLLDATLTCRWRRGGEPPAGFAARMTTGTAQPTGLATYTPGRPQGGTESAEQDSLVSPANSRVSGP